MYVSDKYQIQWWLPPRTGSRMTSEILLKLGFHNEWGHHIMFGESKHDVILNLRNPYSVVVSYYLGSMYSKSKTFKEYLNDKTINHLEKSNKHLMDYTEALRERQLKVKQIVRYENFINDLLSVDFIKENLDLIPEELEKLNMGKTPWRTNYEESLIKPYSDFYNEEIAEMVYHSKKKFFDFGEYSKDSWKILSEK